jgi:nicotinate-nucleotide adenylyltransferase
LKPIVLFGGTFDPVHNGHVAMVNGALQELAPERLVTLPAGDPYQRRRLPFAAASHRATMLQLAFQDIAKVQIDRRELSRAGPTYTLDTLREFREAAGNGVPLIWLLGGDAFAKLDTWHCWQSLFTLAHFAVVLRQQEPHPLESASAALIRDLEGRHTSAAVLGQTTLGRYTILAATVPPVSSTDIRARRINQEPIRGLVPDAVCDYIEQHKLYQSKE